MSHIHMDVKDVSFSYEGGQQILKNVSFFAGEGESIGLVGANGAGKSTLLKLLVGLEYADEGSIRMMEIPVERGTMAKLRERIGYVFQDSDSQLFMSTVYEDIAFGPRNYGLPSDEVERRVARALELTGTTHLRDRQIYKLSGGEKKLVSIATILSMTPDIILMDEPSIALDPQNRRNLIRILNQFGHLKLIASHDLDMIWETCDRTILLDHGSMIADGPTKEILCHKELLEAHGLELPLRLQHL